MSEICLNQKVEFTWKSSKGKPVNYCGTIIGIEDKYFTVHVSNRREEFTARFAFDDYGIEVRPIIK